MGQMAKPAAKARTLILSMVSNTSEQIGALLTQEFLVPSDDVQRALTYQARFGGRLEHILVNIGALPDDRVLDVVSRYTALPQLDLKSIEEQSVKESIESFGTDHSSILPQLLDQLWVPIEYSGDSLRVAVNDPFNLIANELTSGAGFTVELVLAPEATLAAWARLGQSESLGVADPGPAEDDRLLELANEAPVVNLFNSLISRGLRLGASDLHLEPYEGQFRVRYRIDGVLQESERLPLKMQMPLIVRIKILSGMDIAERRRPQDGKIAMRISNESLDLRVSSLPLSAGESMVLRFLQQESVSFALEEMGFSGDVEQQLLADIKKTAGVMLFTGPTGSGKTTTLYSLLNLLNKPNVKIITLEDPVEYQLEGINQVHVNSEIGFDFAAGLRSVVRQDPDVIMVGEIRDRETAQIALQSALTGHLVFSTLHTNDAASAYTRLLDLGVEEFLLNAALISVVAQRLVRRLCSACAVEHPDADALIEQYGLSGHQGQTITPKVLQACGCELCGNTGYRGRIVITEYLECDTTIRGLPKNADFLGAAQAHNTGLGRRTLLDDGLLKVSLGVTTVEEVLRVAG